MKTLSIKQVIEATSLGRSTIYQMVKDGNFPAQVRLSPRRVGWKIEDIDNWIASRP